MRLTDARVASLRPAPGKPQTEYYHDRTPQAGIRVGKDGRRVFFMLYCINGKRKRLSLGEHASSKGSRAEFDPTYTPLTVAGFELAYFEARSKVYQGIDPDPKAAPTATPAKVGGVHIERSMLPAALQKVFPDGVLTGTVGYLLSQYLEKYASIPTNIKPRTYVNYKTDSQMYLKSIFLSPLDAFGQMDVRNLINEIKHRAPQAIRKAKGVLSCAFNWGIEQRTYGITSNPCQGVKVDVPKGKRDRWLTDNEIEKVFEALPRLTDKKAADIYLLILSSMCRPGEAAAIRAEDVISLNGERVWRLKDPKNGREHLIPLSGYIGEIINRRLLAVGNSGPLFYDVPPTNDYPEQLKKANKQLRELTGLNFRPHDLRRTGRTHVSGLGVSGDVAEALLNHVKDGMKAVYDLYSFWPERKAAIRLWHEKLGRIQAGEMEQMAA